MGAVRKEMTDDPLQCMELLLGWRNRKYTGLVDAIGLNEKTIRRMANGETDSKLNTVVRICFGLNLPPTISEKLLDVFGCKLLINNQDHQWIKEAMTILYMHPYDCVVEWLYDYGVEI